MLKQKSFLIFLFFIFLLSSSLVSAHYWDFVTVGQGDGRWCELTGCTYDGIVFFNNPVFFRDNVTIVQANSLEINNSLVIKDFSGDTKILLNATGNSFLNGGNVGIGTTTPSSKLEVDGTLTVKNISSPYANKSYMFFEPSGSIGFTLDPIKSNNDNTIITISNDFIRYKHLASTNYDNYRYDVKINEYDICLTPKFTGSKIIQVCDETIKEGCKLIDKEIFIPETISIFNEKGYVKDIQEKLIGKDFCYTANPLLERYLRLGEDSVVIDGVIKYNSTDYNITQESEYSHLTVNDTSLVLYMPFDNDSSTIARDYTINDNNGAVTGATFNSNGGYIGGAYEFDGDNDYVTLSASDSLNITGNLSIALWVKIKPSSVVRQMFISTKTAGGNFGYYFGYEDQDDELKFEVGNGSTQSEALIAANVLDDSQWHHIVAVYDSLVTSGVNVEFYKDGLSLGSSTTPHGGSVSILDTNYIGALSVTLYHTNGSIDEVMIFNRSLSEGEISNIYNSQYPRFYPRGIQQFNITMGTNNTVDVTLDSCQELNGSNLKLSFNDGDEVEIENCAYSGYNVDGNLNPAEMKLIFHSNEHNFYTPLLSGNIIITQSVVPSAPRFYVQSDEGDLLFWLNKLGSVNVPKDLTVGNGNDNLIVNGDVNITGTLFGGSPVKIAGIDISNNVFMLKENRNSSSRFTLQNLNSGENASTVISAINDVGGTMFIGIGSSNFMLGDMSYPNITALISRSSGDMIFVNSYNKPFSWLYNPSDDNDLNNLVEIMRLDENGLNVSGNVTYREIYGEMHFHKDADGVTIPIASSGVWVNVTVFNGTGADMTQNYTNGFTFDPILGSLSCDLNMRISTWYTFSTGNAGNNQEYQWSLAINNAVQEITDSHRKIGAAGDVGVTTGGGSIVCNQGDVIQLQVRNNDGTADLEAHASTVVLKRIGQD